MAHELKKQQPTCKLIYIGETGGKFFDLAKQSGVIDESYAVSAGKFRRYNSRSFLAHLFDIKTNVLNVRDLIRLALGMGQSKRLLKRIKPDVVFIKGGFVGVPVGKASAKLGIPYITHDSDTVPGLANRLISKNAFLHTVGMPKEFYSYPPDKTEVVGIPLTPEFTKVNDNLLQQYRNYLNVPLKAEVVFITGGSQGAHRLNSYMSLIAEDLLTKNPNLYIMHQAGKGELGVYSHLNPELQHRVKVYEFIDDLYRYSGAADLVIARAGASTIAELALQEKAVILVPNPYLTGGHQLVNASHLTESGAVKVIHEETLNTDPEALVIAITALLSDKTGRDKLGKQLGLLAHPNAAKDIAGIIIDSVDYITEQKQGGQKNVGS